MAQEPSYIKPNPKEMTVEDKVMDMRGKWRCPKCNGYWGKPGYHAHLKHCDGKPRPAGLKLKPNLSPYRSKMNTCQYCGQQYFGRAIAAHRLNCLENPKRLRNMANLTQWKGLSVERFVERFGSPPPPPEPNPPTVQITTADGQKFIFDAEDGI